MSTPIQIVVDCADPHGLARFWAAALGVEVEDHHDIVREAIAADQASRTDALEVDGRLAWRGAAACADPAGTVPRMVFQQVPEPKTTKNRVHLDLHVGAERRDAEVERLLALGARRLWEASQGPWSWVTLADPEGNELCVA